MILNNLSFCIPKTYYDTVPWSFRVQTQQFIPHAFPVFFSFPNEY